LAGVRVMTCSPSTKSASLVVTGLEKLRHPRMAFSGVRDFVREMARNSSLILPRRSDSSRFGPPRLGPASGSSDWTASAAWRAVLRGTPIQPEARITTDRGVISVSCGMVSDILARDPARRAAFAQVDPARIQTGARHDESVPGSPRAISGSAGGRGNRVSRFKAAVVTAADREAAEPATALRSVPPVVLIQIVPLQWTLAVSVSRRWPSQNWKFGE